MAVPQTEQMRQSGITRRPTNPLATVTSNDRSAPDTLTPVNQDGCFEFDRVLKSGYVEKRTRKTKQWKTIFIVLRPNALSIYKNEKESKLRHKIEMSDVTAVAFLKDRKHKRHNVFGVFSPARNFHFQARSQQEADEWVDLIRKEARVDEEEEEMYLASPTCQRGPILPGNLPTGRCDSRIAEGFLSSSPEPMGPSRLTGAMGTGGHHYGARRMSSMVESSGLSGNELASHSDFSDNDVQQRLRGTSIDSLAVRQPNSLPNTRPPPPNPVGRTPSQLSVANLEKDPDRVIWQGRLKFLRTKGGVKQWKDMWAVLRPRNCILYKDESEYAAQWIVQMSAVVDVVDIDPLSKSKVNCMQIITEEKSYRFCAPDEESLVQCLGAFKSLLSKRRGLEARTAAASTSPPNGIPVAPTLNTAAGAAVEPTITTSPAATAVPVSS